MCRHRNNPSDTMNNQGHLGAQEEKEKSPAIKVLEYYDLDDREFKIAIMERFNDI